jgi:hypothetical protein
MKISRRTLSLLLALCTIFSCVCFTDVAQQSFAQEEEIIPTGISPLSKRTSLLDVPISVFPLNYPNRVPKLRFQELYEIKVVIQDRTQGRIGLDMGDFLELSKSALTSGLALYKESGSQPGFHYSPENRNSDIPVNLRELPLVEEDPVTPGTFVVTFRPTLGDDLTALSQIYDQFADFYIVAQTSIDLLHGDSFEVSIPADGITVVEKNNVNMRYTLYSAPFPGLNFQSLNPAFARPAIFQGDIVRVISTINELENQNRLDMIDLSSSESKTILGFDMAGREDQDYFLKEVKVNFYGTSLQALAPHLKRLSMISGVENPTFMHGPMFYNFPEDESGGILTQTTFAGDEVSLTMPLDDAGNPLPAFMLGMDNLNSHVTSYVSHGPRNAFSDLGLFPRQVNVNILQSFNATGKGGIFLYRDLGGVKGQYDEGIDHILKLDADKFNIEPLAVAPEDIQLVTSPYRALISRLIPTVPGSYVADALPMLFDDTNLLSELLGIPPDFLPPPAEEPRPPLGSLESYLDPDTFFFDQIINVQRPYLGLTEGQMRYMAEYTEGNGRTNSEDMYGWPMVHGFTVTLPVSKDNARSDLLVPSGRTGANAGAEIYVAIRTGEELRSLDSLLPFIEPKDITVGTQVANFVKGSTEGVTEQPSVSSIGMGFRDTDVTAPLIGRPRPRVRYTDLTQTQGDIASSNILYDRSLGAPPKAVIGIDVVDFGQNPTLVENYAGIRLDVFDTFFTESAVLGELMVEFLPTVSSFNPLMFAPIPLELGILPDNRVTSAHSVALYVDDDTPMGNRMDDDGDGLVDEEFYNLQDDDGDGLIDEDLGDGTPAGINGIFDAHDKYMPLLGDDWGSGNAFSDAQYFYEPNNQAKYQEFLDLITTDSDITLEDGGVMPLNTTASTWFAELDFRVMNFANFSFARTRLFPRRFMGIDPTPGPDYGFPRYNMGRIPGVDPRNAIIDLVSMLRGGIPTFPYYPEDLFIEDPETGEIIWMLALEADGDNIQIISDPDGDPYRTFALSVVNAFRFPDPSASFVRFKYTPMVVDAPALDGTASDGGNPQGDSMSPVYSQFGFWMGLDQDLGDYIGEISDALGEAFEEAYTAIEEYNTAVEEAIAAAADAEEPTDPEYPEYPEVIEVGLGDPYESLGINDFLEGNGGSYDTNYLYQIQLPDENFGPLAGDDFYVVVRASNQARVGDTFRMRISQGELDATFSSTDPDSGEITTGTRPSGGITYHSFTETSMRENYRGIMQGQITTGPLVVRSKNVPPTFRFTNPTSGLNMASSDFMFQISFIAEDVDNVADIQLFVDTDNQDFDGQFIPGAFLKSGFTNSFMLDMREHIQDFDPTLTYYVYARVSDGVNSPLFVYSDGPISTPVSRGGDDDPIGGGNTIAINGPLVDKIDYIKLGNDGRVFSLGESPAFLTPQIDAPIVDGEVNSTFSGMIFVQKDGRVLGSGTIGVFQNLLQPNSELVFKPEDIAFYKNDLAGGAMILSPTPDQIQIESARDIEVDFLNGAIYVLDGDGDMLFLGKNANRTLIPEPMGLDIYRDMELSPLGDAMYFLTGHGLLFSAGAASIAGWSDPIGEDKYRDMSLITNSVTVQGIVITDDDGKVSFAGDDGGYASLLPATDIIPGTIRQVKLVPNLPNTLLLVEGSGKVNVLSNDDIAVPQDSFIFANQEGLDNDQIVDVETTFMNLQSVVASVDSILQGFRTENLAQIMAHVSPDYKDRHGADAAGFQRALSTMFEFYEMRTFSQSAGANTFTLVNQGDTVTANVTYDFFAMSPTLQSYMPTAEDAGSKTTVAYLTYLNGSQDVTMFEAWDGRSWTVEVWKITEVGRRIDEVGAGGEVDEELLDYLTRRVGNMKIGEYTPVSKGPDPAKRFSFKFDESNPYAITGMLLIFKEYALFQEAVPPVIYHTLYNTQAAFAEKLDTTQMKFARQNDGTFKLVSMNLRCLLQLNDGTDIQTEPEDEYTPPVLDIADELIQAPYGLDLARRGVVLTAIEGDADVVYQDDTFITGSSTAQIMMLPENTDIFSIDPVTYIQTISRSIVRMNPYDLNQQTQGATDTPTGRIATAEAGRAYLVILKDGLHYGFFQVPETTAVVIPGGGTGGAGDGIASQLPIDIRFEDSWVLPEGF